MLFTKYKITEKQEKEMRKLIRRVYKFLNGKINPRYKSYKLVIHNEMRVGIGGESKKIYAATADAGCVDIYLNDIVEFFGLTRSKLCSEYMYKGYIICLVAHELSHIDQYMPIFMTDLERLCIEVGNELNTLSYIEKYRSELENEFGPFSTTEYQARSAYLNDENTEIFHVVLDAVKKNTEIFDILSYKKINSPITKLWYQLSGLSLMDIYSYISDHEKLERIGVIVRDLIINDSEQVLMININDMRQPETYQTYQKADFALEWITDSVYNGLTWEVDVYIPDEQPDLLVIGLTSVAAMKKATAIETYEANVKYWDSVCPTDHSDEFMNTYQAEKYVEDKNKLYQTLLDNLKKEKEKEIV